MKKLSNWYLMWATLAIALQSEQDNELSPETSKKPNWPKYAAIPKGCKIHKENISFKDTDGLKKNLCLYVVASNEKNAKKKFENLKLELRAWNGEQKELELIIKKHNKYCAPVKVI